MEIIRTRLCNACLKNKPMSEFYLGHDRHPRVRCKKCRQDKRPMVKVPEPKACKDCGIVKPPDQYHKGSPKSRDGLQVYCKDCDKARMQESHYKRTYGIERGEYERRLAEQGHACKLCGKRAEEMMWAGKPSRLAVDHCHRTGAVRGLVCHKCNQRISMIDDPEWAEWMAKARAYLGGK